MVPHSQVRLNSKNPFANFTNDNVQLVHSLLRPHQFGLKAVRKNFLNPKLFTKSMDFSAQRSVRLGGLHFHPIETLLHLPKRGAQFMKFSKAAASVLRESRGKILAVAQVRHRRSHRGGRAGTRLPSVTFSSHIRTLLTFLSFLSPNIRIRQSRQTQPGALVHCSCHKFVPFEGRHLTLRKTGTAGKPTGAIRFQNPNFVRGTRNIRVVIIRRFRKNVHPNAFPLQMYAPANQAQFCFNNVRVLLGHLRNHGAPRPRDRPMLRAPTAHHDVHGFCSVRRIADRNFALHRSAIVAANITCESPVFMSRPLCRLRIT